MVGPVVWGAGKNIAVAGKVLNGGMKVARFFATGNRLMPIAIVRTAPGIILRIGAGRASNCRTMRLNCRRVHRMLSGGPTGNRTTGTGATPGHFVHRFGGIRLKRCRMKGRVGISVFTTNSVISIANAAGKRNFRNMVGHRKRDHKPVTRKSHCRHHPNSVNTTSFPSHMFGNGGLTKHVNGSHIAVRGLRIIVISIRGGMVLVGKGMPNSGGSLVRVGMTHGTTGGWCGERRRQRGYRA